MKDKIHLVSQDCDFIEFESAYLNFCGKKIVVGRISAFIKKNGILINGFKVMEPKYRHHGVGKRLLTALESYCCVELGIHHFMVFPYPETDIDNVMSIDAIKSVYYALGFSPDDRGGLWHKRIDKHEYDRVIL